MKKSDRRLTSSEFSIVLAWRAFEEEYLSDSMPLHLQLLIEKAYFMGAKDTLNLKDDGNTEADIIERLLGLHSQMDHEREQFLKTPEGKGF